MNNTDLDTLRAELEKAGKLTENGNPAEAERLLLGVLAALDTLRANSSTPEDDVLFLRMETLNDLGGVLRGDNRREESRNTLETALALAIKTGNDEQQSRSLHILAMLCLDQREFAEAMQYFMPALALSRKTGIHLRTANILSNIGLLHLEHGDFEKALDYYSESLPLHEQVDNRISIAITTFQIGLIYDDLLQHEKSLEYNLRSLALFEEMGYMSDVGGMLNNVGFNYANLGNYAKAHESYLRSIALHEQNGNTRSAAYPYTNLGDLLRQMGHYDESLERLTAGLALTRSEGDRLQEGRTLAYLARLFATEDFDGVDTEQSRQYTLEALAVFEEIQATDPRATVEIVKQHGLLAELYRRQGEFEAALRHFTEFHNLDKAVRNEGTLAKSAQFEQKVTYATERARHEATEELLHKTLPRSIADRVMRGETRIADHFENVSILFADVVGFTQLSAKLPPAIVLGFMNFIFEHFDSLALKHGCERIKTIGDGYMAVCGAPVRYDNHAERLALMALDMMEDIQLPEEIRKHLPKGTLFHLRIGLHCGEITAGLIGTGKLAYDIYGDAVNTAARMESHGEAGRIQVSGEFMNAVGGVHELPLRFIDRGEMEIKGKGKMRTYYLEKRSN
ncbi:MAG: tetratricopeptide repeat protein [Bacteroidetes bacterium]|nr:tetratricopeptide repeat protein [Bacteroidota bacterium]